MYNSRFLLSRLLAQLILLRCTAPMLGKGMVISSGKRKEGRTPTSVWVQVHGGDPAVPGRARVSQRHPLRQACPPIQRILRHQTRTYQPNC